VDYEFVTACVKCGKDFTIFWVIDQIRVSPKSVARISCPTCGERFFQKVSDLIPFKYRRVGLVRGRPVRTVELIYDCPSCGMRGISMTQVHTDLSWDDLARETIQPAICNNIACPQRGLQQKVKPVRTRLGALNPSWK
jgi:DNA-directed RNA polymerase subunit RPC12/RpoP